MRRLIAIAALLTLPLAAQVRPNPAFRAKSVPANDDGSSGLEPLGWTLNFFGRLRTSAFVNNNGNITFDAALPTYTPFGLTGVSREIIAPFFADVDTRSTGSALVTYGQDVIDGRRAFGVNWINVGYYNQKDDKLNSFQLVLIERPDTGQGNFDIEFNYEKIQWETGDASGGTGGRGGVSASAGWSNGSGQPGTSYELPGSLIPGSFLDGGGFSLVRNRTPGATGQAGRWLYRARGGTVIPALTILTGCPAPNATAGRMYNFRFEAFGSRPPYRWSVQPDPDSALPNLNMNAGGFLTGAPSAPGVYAFTVRVAATDEDGEVTVSRRCSITVDPPTITIPTSSTLPSAGAGRPYEARIRADGGAGPFRFDLVDSSPIPGLALNPNGTLTGMPMFPGTYRIQVQARSEGADRAVPATKVFTLNVAAPELTIRSACPLPNGTGNVPYSHQFTVTGGAPPYRWSTTGPLPTGLSLSPEGVLSGTPSVPHWWPFSVQVRDSRGNSAETGCGVVILFPEVRVTSACPLPGGTTGEPYSRQLQAAGGFGPYRWNVIGTLPRGLTLSGEGMLSGTPIVAGPGQFQLRVTDSRGQTAVQGCNLPVNRGPYSIASCPLPSTYVGQTYSHQLYATGGNEPYFWIEAAPLPQGLRLSPAGFLSGVLNTPGTFRVSMRATDQGGLTTTRTCDLTVLPQTLRLENPCEARPARLGEPYTHALSAAGGVEPYQFSVRGQLPPGLRLMPNGTLMGTPTQPGVFPVEYTVTDRTGRTSSTPCAVVVEIPDLPGLRLTGLPASLSPASAGPTVRLELGAAYPFPLEGEMTLAVTPDTNSPTPEVNRPDPAVRFTNGQRTVPFRIAAGSRDAGAQIQNTGTVASTLTVGVSRLRITGSDVDFARQPSQAVGRVPRSAPVITNVCYAPTMAGFDIDISGYSTTRDLVRANLTFGANTFHVDLTLSALDYFATEESARTGGTFRVRAPYRLTQGNAQSLGQGNVVISNSAGSSASRQIQRCQ